MPDYPDARERRRMSVQAVLDEVPGRLRALRGERRMRSVLARQTGIDRDTLRRIETKQQPTLEQLLLICDALDADPALILAGRSGRGGVASASVEAQEHGITWRAVAPTFAANPVEQTLPATHRELAREHDGTEWVYVIDGDITLRLGGSDVEYQLEPRVAVEFDASIRHQLINRAQTPALVLRRMSAHGMALHAGLDAGVFAKG